LAATQLAALLERIDRLIDRHWWFGARWSIVDVYVSWIVGMSRGVGLACEPARLSPPIPGMSQLG